MYLPQSPHERGHLGSMLILSVTHKPAAASFGHPGSESSHVSINSAKLYIYIYMYIYQATSFTLFRSVR